jgi:enterochelin esterase-like enzyme
MIDLIPAINIESYVLPSKYLNRDVLIDFYFEKEQFANIGDCHLLLINDGQDLVGMSFAKILTDLYLGNEMNHLLCVGIHCGADRRNEYGVVGETDYMGRGSKAASYEKFIFKELFSFIFKKFHQGNFRSLAFCGFSLGGLSALDIVWRNGGLFHTVGVFSGSLWWRSVSQNDKNFDENKHRIMHKRIREGSYTEGMRFFFETGTLDETADRNHNGIIDSIDDTLSLIGELEKKGYIRPNDIKYLELQDGHHDVPTWGRALPVFLKWAFGKD